MTEHKKSLQKAEQTNKFFDEILTLVEDFTGKELVDTFQRIKAQRDRYLREQWSDGDESAFPLIIRDIDYDHLITVLDEFLSNQVDTIYNLYTSLSKICFRYGEFEKGRLLLVKLETLDLNPEQRAQVEMLFGQLNLLMNKWDLSTQHYDTAMNIYKEIGNQQGIAKVYNNLGINSYEQWQTEIGKKYLEKAQIITKEIEDDNLHLIVQTNLGIVQNIRGEFEDAKQNFEHLLKTLMGSNLTERAAILINKGMATRDLRQFETAAKSLNEAASIAQETKNNRLLALAYLALAEVNIYRSQFDESNKALNQAFVIFAQRHDKLHLASVYHIFGLLHMHEEHYDLSDSEFRMSININEEHNEILMLACVYRDYSKLAVKFGDKEAQKKRLHKALELFKSIQAVKRVERIEQELGFLE